MNAKAIVILSVAGLVIESVWAQTTAAPGSAAAIRAPMAAQYTTAKQNASTAAAQALEQSTQAMQAVSEAATALNQWAAGAASLGKAIQTADYARAVFEALAAAAGTDALRQAYQNTANAYGKQAEELFKQGQRGVSAAAGKNIGAAAASLPQLDLSDLDKMTHIVSKTAELRSQGNNAGAGTITAQAQAAYAEREREKARQAELERRRLILEQRGVLP